MNSNQYNTNSNSYGYNQPVGKHNLPPIAALSSAVNYRATARNPRPSDTSAGYGGQAQQQQEMYNQGNYSEPVNSNYQYTNTSYNTMTNTQYPEQQTNNYNTFNQRPVDPPSNSQPSYLVPQTNKAKAATYSDSRFGMFPEPDSQKHLDNYVKPSQSYGNYPPAPAPAPAPLPNFKDLTSSYSHQQQQFSTQAPQPSPSKQSNPSPVPKPTDVAKASTYSGANQMQASDWMNKSEYQNQMNSNQSKMRTEAADYYSKKLQAMSATPANNQPSFQSMSMEPKSSYPSQNYGYSQQGQNRTSSNSSYQMFNSSAQGDIGLLRDHDGFKVPQQMQPSNMYQTQTGHYLPEVSKSFEKDSSKSFQHQKSPSISNSKSIKSPSQYDYGEQKQTDSLPNIAQFDYKMNDRMNPSMKQQSYSMNNLNTVDNRYPNNQLTSNPPLDNRLNSYASSESLHSSYMNKDLNFDQRYNTLPGASKDKTHHSTQNMDYNYRHSSNFQGQSVEANTLDNRLVPNQPDSKPNHPPNDLKPSSDNLMMKTNYPSSSFISDKFNSMSASNQNDSKSMQHHGPVAQNSYNFQSQQYQQIQQPAAETLDTNNRSFYPEQVNDTTGRPSPHRTKLQSQGASYSTPSPHNIGGSPRSSVLNSSLNNLYNTPSQSLYKIPASPKASHNSQTSVPSSPKGSISNPPHNTLPQTQSPYSSIPASPNNSASLPHNYQHSISPIHTSMPSSSSHSSPKQVPPSPSPNQICIPPSPHQTSIPPSPHQTSIPSSPHQTFIPLSPHPIPPSPSPHKIPPSPHPVPPAASPYQVPPCPSPQQISPAPSPHQITSSPSLHQTSVPFSLHQIPPAPSPLHVPPSPSSHQTPIPSAPSSHQTSVPSAPHQVSPTPSPHQTSVPPALNSHQIHSAPSPNHSSIPPTSDQDPSSTSSHQTHMPTLPTSTEPEPLSPKTTHEQSLTPPSQPSISPGASFSQSSLPSDPLSMPTTCSLSIKTPQIENVEKSSTDLEIGYQSSSDQLCLVPESQNPPADSSMTSCPSVTSLDISTPMDLEQYDKSPSSEFQTLQPDSVSPKVVSSLNEGLEAKEDGSAQDEPERLKTPELKKCESSNIIVSEVSNGEEKMEVTSISCSSKIEQDIENPKIEIASDISNKNVEHIDKKNHNSSEILNLNNVVTKPSNKVEHILDTSCDSSEKGQTESNDKIETKASVNDSLPPNVDIFKDVTIELSQPDSSSQEINDLINENNNENCVNNDNDNQTVTHSSSDEQKQEDLSLKEIENNVVEKMNSSPSLQAAAVSENKDRSKESVHDALSQDKENCTENVRPLPAVEEETKLHTNAKKPNEIIQQEGKISESTINSNSDLISIANDTKHEKHVSLENNVSSTDSSQVVDENSCIENEEDTTNCISENLTQETNLVEENSKFYKANVIQSNINRLKEESRNKSVIENVVSILSKGTVEKDEVQHQLENQMEPPACNDNEPKLQMASNILSSKNTYLDIHHSETTKILEHVAATLANHKRKINDESDSKVAPGNQEYVEKPILKDTSEEDEEEVIKANVVSYEMDKSTHSVQKEEPQNLSVEKNVSKESPKNSQDTPVIDAHLTLIKDKVVNMDVATASTKYFTPKDRIRNYEHQMSMEAKQPQALTTERLHILDVKSKSSGVLKVERLPKNTSETSKARYDGYHPHQVQNENITKPLFNYETYMKQKQLLSTSMGRKADTFNEQYEKKIKSTTVMPGPGAAHALPPPPPAHGPREDMYSNISKNVSLPQASLNFQRKDLGLPQVPRKDLSITQGQRKDLVLSQVQAAEKYSDIQLQQYYEQQQKYTDYERYILKQSAESSHQMMTKDINPALGTARKESKPPKKQSRVSDKGLDSTTPRLSLQDQQKEYMKFLQKQQQYQQYDPSSSQSSDRHKSQKSLYEDQYKLQNYVQHIAQEEAKKRKQQNEQRVAEQQKYELDRLQQKDRYHLNDQQRSLQDQYYSSRHGTQPYYPATASSSNSSRDRQKPSLPPHNAYPYNFPKQDTKPGTLHEYDLTQHIKNQGMQPHQQSEQSKSNQTLTDGVMQQYQQSQQQLADNIRRQQQARPAPVQQEPSRVSNEKQKSQPVKKRQYNPVSTAPAPPQNTQVSSVSSSVRGTIASPLDLSVKTVRQSADSTAKDEEGHRSAVSSSVPKLDISSNFTNQSLMSSMFSTYNALSSQPRPHPSQSVPHPSQTSPHPSRVGPHPSQSVPYRHSSQAQSSQLSPYQQHPSQSVPPKKQKKSIASTPLPQGIPAYDTLPRGHQPPYDTSRGPQAPYEALVSPRGGPMSYDPMRRDPTRPLEIQHRYPGASSKSPGSSMSPGSKPSLPSPNLLSPSNRHGMSPLAVNTHNPYANFKPDQYSPKRPAANLASISPVPSKHAKVENWRQTIDFQIDQKLAKAQQQFQQNQISEKQLPSPGPQLPQPGQAYSNRPSPNMLSSPNYPQQQQQRMPPPSPHVVTSLPSSQPVSSPSYLQNQQAYNQQQSLQNQQQQSSRHQQQQLLQQQQQPLQHQQQHSLQQQQQLSLQQQQQQQ
uniref:Uncharacterized protein n=1 Tax=Cacopsylla melanoneura TaxID=428564 RepID=A0A8D8V7Z0_9HEMI